MRKRGQSHLLYYLIALLLLGAIALSYKAVKDVGERQADAETQVLVSSLQAEILKQAGREQGAMSNLSLSVPGTISEVCFFDSGAPSDSLKNIELTQLYAGDQTKLFLRMKGSYLAFPLDKAAFKENPLCIAPVQGTLNLALESTGKAALVSGGGISKCTTVMQSGAPEDKVDLVFLGYGYGSQEDFSRDAFRFANKVFAIRAAARTTSHEPRATRLFWLDADVVTFEPVPLTLLDEVLPPDVALSCLDRGPYPSECGFVGYNLAHPATLPFIEALASLYASDEVFKLQEWHDSYVFDWLRRKGNVPAHCIPYAAGQKRHPFVNSALGRYMDHLKGPRKHLGKTPRGEVVTHRDVGYWRT